MRLQAAVFFTGEAPAAGRIKALRGREIALVPQSVNYLDPLMKVGRQIIGETKKRQKAFGEADQGKRQAEARMRDLLGRYGLADEVADLYPFELSGGMARRVLLLTALMRQPRRSLRTSRRRAWILRWQNRRCGISGHLRTMETACF